MGLNEYKAERLATLRSMDISELRQMLKASLNDPDLAREDRDAVEADLAIGDDLRFQQAVLERARFRLEDMVRQMKS